MRAGKIVMIVVGALLVLIGLALLAPGAFLLWAYGTQRDDAGFFETSDERLTSSGYALSTPDIDLHIGSDVDWVPRGGTAAVRIRVESTDSGPVFVGIGPTDQVSQYLAGVSHDEVTGFGWFSGGNDYRHVDGGAPSAPPGQQGFWVASLEGTGPQNLEWDVEDGNWTAVIMNADATADVNADVRLGARFDLLLPIGIGLTVAGVVLLAGGVLLIVFGVRKPRMPAYGQPYPGQPYPGQPPYHPPEPGDYPPGAGYPPAEPPAGSPPEYSPRRDPDAPSKPPPPVD